MTQYEYRILTFEYNKNNVRDLSQTKSVELELNKLGREGWELVLCELSGTHVYIFKRPIK